MYHTSESTVKNHSHSISETSPILGDVESFIAEHDFTTIPEVESVLGLKSDSHRVSILTESALTELDSVAGSDAVNTLTKTPLGYTIQIFIFLWLTLSIGLSPFFGQLALLDPETGKKVVTFLPQAPYVADFFIAIVIANFLTLIFWGKKGLRECWNIRQIIKLSPISLFHGLSESAELGALIFVDGTLRAVINQFKLPVVGLLRRLLMKESRTAQQWLIIISITIAVWGFILSDIKSQVSTERIQEILGPGLNLSLAAVGFGLSAGLVGDTLMKRSSQPFIVQMAQIRVTTMLVVLIVMIIYAYWIEQLWKLCFYGWNWRVVILVVWLVLKDFTTLYVLKRLNSFWPALASSSGLIVTFFTDFLYFKEAFRPMSFIFVFLISLLVVILSLSKKKSGSR